MNYITSYPLCWPITFQRSASRQRASFGRKSSVFQSSYSRKEPLTVAIALGRLKQSMSAFTKPGKSWRIEWERVVVSTNLPTRMDGLPISGRSEPSDPGVAVYFEMDGKPVVMCCDKWDRVADNIAAISATLDAMRGLERWGVSEAERAFTGFQALPEPGKASARTCWQVLGIPPTHDPSAIDAAWRERAKQCHPDKPGGSHEAMSELNTARDQAHACLPKDS